MAVKVNKSPELDEALAKEQAGEVQLGVEQAARGKSEPWNLEATLAEAHRRHADRTKQT